MVWLLEFVRKVQQWLLPFGDLSQEHCSLTTISLSAVSQRLNFLSEPLPKHSLHKLVSLPRLTQYLVGSSPPFHLHPSISRRVQTDRKSLLQTIICKFPYQPGWYRYKWSRKRSSHSELSWDNGVLRRHTRANLTVRWTRLCRKTLRRNSIDGSSNIPRAKGTKVKTRGFLIVKKVFLNKIPVTVWLYGWMANTVF